MASTGPALVLALVLVRAVVAVAVGADQEPLPATTASARLARDCVAIGSHGRLNAGSDFSIPLGRGLAVRLSADRITVDPIRATTASYGWTISVVTLGGDDDFMWVVTPPYQSAPHRSFGPVYGLTATESASFERHLRFVLNARDYTRARALYESWASGKLESVAFDKARARLATGSLRIRITKFATRPHLKTPYGEVEAFDWIEFSGRACFPQQPVP